MSAAASFPWPEFPAVSIETDFRSMFAHAPMAAARCDGQGMILETNPAFEQALNGKKTHEGMLRLSDVIAMESGASAHSLLREVIEGRRTSAQLEGKKTCDEAGTRWVAWRLSAAGAEPVQVLLVAQPRRGVDFAETDLLQAQRWEAVGRLTSGVVHDFNNLLTGVMLYSDLLLFSLDAGDARLRGYAEEIRGAVAHAAILVRQLLMFARPKSAGARPICLNEVTATMQALLARLIGENIALELRLDPALGLVEIDWAQAEQVMLNLILNSRDALPEGGRITVETSNCKIEGLKPSGQTRTCGGFFPCVQLVVSDNGHGMDAETRQRLFEPFFTTKGGGTGLGLATIRSIVTNHRGLIHVESEAGRGTRVMVLLPQSSPTSSFHLAASDSLQPTLREVPKEPHL
jgi:signal transduction histidine kinase